MNQKGFMTAFILIGILITAVIAGGVYYLKIQRSTTSTPSSIMNPQTMQPTPTTDETADWKTFKGKAFEFKYPSNGEVVTESSSTTYISYEEGTKPYWTFTVNLADNPSHLTTKQVVDKKIAGLRNNKNAPWAKSQADQMQQSMKDYTNGQIIGIKLQSFDEGYPQEFGDVVQATESTIYTFHVGDGSGGGVGGNEERLLDKILATFEFVK